MRTVVALLVAGALVMPAQREITFRTTTQLVVVSVSAKDEKGNPIEGLKASDFLVSEDGKPQKLSVFEYQRLEDAPPPAPEVKQRPAPGQPPPSARPDGEARIAPARPQEIKYRDRRLLVLFFDQAGMPVADQMRAQQAALRFVNTRLTASDLVAVMVYATTLKVLQDFTGDRDQLAAVIRGLAIGETGMENGATEAENEADTGAAYTQDDSEFNIFNTDRKLAALETAVRMLGSLAEKKALVYFASGMSRTGVDNQAQLRSTINAAIRSNVAFYPVDARGLVAAAPMGDATRGSPGGRGMYSGDSQRSSRNSFQAQQESLYTLAADTGGKALLDQNDLSLGIVQVQKDISSYYILGYYSSNTAADGKYRRIKVEVAKSLNAKLDYRSGYFGSKEFRQFSASDRERQLQEALLLGDPVTDLSIALEVNYFRLGRDRYFVPVAVKIPGSDIELARKGGAESTRLDFIGEVRDSRGSIQGTVRDEITVKLKGDQAGQLSSRNLQYDTGFTLQPGTYTLKFLARENETGKMGTFETKFAVPDLTAEPRRLPISSVVLSNQREKISDLLASAEKNRKLLDANPLVHGNEKLVPSVTRVFRKDQEMFVYLEAYQPAAASADFMLATVSFYRGKTKAFETEPLAITEGLNPKTKAVPVRFGVPMSSLQPGRYTCQVNVIDPAAQKFAVWRSTVVLLP
ncbi:MAG: VWA domain-containing protein [Acidobacteria bacterium]|nr:VWA domain-containing protein [Acidobacteriota bacterium]MBI3280144.1 VWA domain-containing protein [Acidobacteriota bacterium]